MLATCWGVINALDTPARRALVPTLVPPRNAASASALTGTALLIGMTVGSALGGTLVATVGVTAVFAVNAASFLADVVVLSTSGLANHSWCAELLCRLGKASARGAHALTMQVSVPMLVRQGFTDGPAQLGAALTAVAAGSLTGTLVAAGRGMPGPLALALATSSARVRRSSSGTVAQPSHWPFPQVRLHSAKRQPSQYASTLGSRRPRMPTSRTVGSRPPGARNQMARSG